MIAIAIEEPYITLQHLLKSEGMIATGGSSKSFLQEHSITVNGIPETRRGRKLRPGDTIVIAERTLLIVAKPSHHPGE